MKTSCIRHPDNDPLTIIRSWSLLSCDGNQCAASLLSYFEYWHNLMEERSIRARELNDQMEARGGGRPENESLLQYHTEKHLISGVLVYGRDSVRNGIKILSKIGFITIHVNQADPTDRSRFYLFHPSVVNDWITTNLIKISETAKKHRGGSGKLQTQQIIFSDPLPLPVDQSSVGLPAPSSPDESYPQAHLVTPAPIVEKKTMHRREADDDLIETGTTPPEAAPMLIVGNQTMQSLKLDDASSESERCIVDNQTMHRLKSDDDLIETGTTPPEAAPMLIVGNQTMQSLKPDDASSETGRCKDVVVVFKETTTPLPPFAAGTGEGQASASAPGLVVPTWLKGDFLDSILKLVEQAPSHAQDILDEVDGMHQKGAIRSSPVGLAAKLVAAVHDGKFVSVAGLSVKAKRNKPRQSIQPNVDQGLPQKAFTRDGWNKAKADIKKLGLVTGEKMS